METVFIVVVSVIVILTSAWIARKNNTKKQLPGPFGLPFVGYLPFMTKTPYIQFQQLAKKYGPVYSVQLGSRNIVLLCDFKNIKEAFSDDAFMGRPADLPIDLTETTLKTGAFLDLPWKEQRRFSLHALRDLGFGKTQMEEHIKEEILELLERLEEQKNTPLKMSIILAPSASNNIASLLFGKRLKYDDPNRKRLDKLLGEVGLLAGTVGWQLFFPWIRAFMKYFKIGNNGKLTRALDDLREYVKEEIAQHESTLDSNNIRDYIDAYLIEIEKKKDDINSGFKKGVLEDIARGFFGAGSETVRITVDWMLLIVANFPDVQKKIHQEIDDVLGRDRFPTYQDHHNMPYTEAAIHELMRWRSIIPLNIMRYTLKDFELNGYFIPKNSHILAVIYAPDHDETLWGEDVNEYKPERFLTKDGKEVVKPEYFIPFSIGKRSCPGKALALVEVFLYFTAILQRFKITMPPGKKANFEGVLGIGLQPQRQDICLETR